MEKRWIKLKEAAYYSGIGRARLIQLAEAGAIRGARDPDNKRRDWVFDRLSIDAYRDAQMPGEDAEQKALEIMRS